MTEAAAPQPDDTVVVSPAGSNDPVVATPAAPNDLAVETPFGPPLTVSPDGQIGTAPARVASQMRRFDRSLLDLVQQQSTLKLFFLWMGTIVISGLCFWLGARAGEHGLVEGGHPVGADFNGFISAIYFSFVTATSIGYGDIVPVGFARVIACAEAVTALLIFGAVVAKFVSHRSDLLVGEIHRVTFEERLDRIQTNLHLVISDLISITAVTEVPDPPINRIAARLESSMLLFQTEMRTIHDLLYQPKLTVEEGVLSTILADLSLALTVFVDLLAALPPDFPRSQPFGIVLQNLTRYAHDICGDCVPHSYTPRLVFWMDRIKATADRIK
jgi:Ion channel